MSGFSTKPGIGRRRMGGCLPERRHGSERRAMPRFLTFVHCLGLSLICVSAMAAPDCTYLRQNIDAYQKCMSAQAQQRNRLQESASELHLPAAKVTPGSTEAQTS